MIGNGGIDLLPDAGLGGTAILSWCETRKESQNMSASDAMSVFQSRGQTGDRVRCGRCSDDRQIELIQTYGVARYFCATCSYDWAARHASNADDAAQTGQQ